MHKTKKSQSIAINTTIVSVVALVVLIVVIIIFTNQSSSAAQTLQSCKLKNGECAINLPSNTGKEIKNLKCDDKEYNAPLIINDPACGESKLCCLKVG